MMKTKFNITKLVLCALCLLWVLSASAHNNLKSLKTNTNSVSNLNYKVLSETYATCEVTTGDYTGNIIIPETTTLNGKTYKVIGIGPSAFRETTINSLVMTDNIEYIRDYALYDAVNLQNVVLSNKITEINQYVFRGCLSLKSIELTSFIQKISWAAFEYTGLTSISIPASVSELDRWAFTNNTNLKIIRLSENSALTIAGDTFNRCPNITDIYVRAQEPPTFTGDDFDNYNATVHVPLGTKEKYKSANVWKKFRIVEVDENGNDIIKAESLTISPSELYLQSGEHAQLTETVLPLNTSNPFVTWYSSNNNIAQVNESGFVTAINTGETQIVCTTTDGTNISASCKVTVTNKTASSITVSPSYAELEIGETAQLKATIMPIDVANQVVLWTSSDDNMAIVTSSGKVYALTKGEVIISAKTTDGSNLEATCRIVIKGLNYNILDFADGTCEVAPGEYTGDINVPTTTYIDGSTYRVIGIGESAFEGCEVTSINLPQSLTYIGASAFAGCKKLSAIDIPRNVCEIGEVAFASCDSLTTMVVESGNSVYDSREGCNAIIHTSSNTLVAGCNGTIIPSSVTNIWPSAFFGCIGLEQVTIPSGVKIIRQSTFEECTGLKHVSLPNTLTFIGNSAFYDCQSLTDIQLPSSLVTIDENAFLGCSSLTSLVVPNHVTSIGEDAFDECPGILTLTLPASLTEIGDEAFKGCKKLKEIHSKITNLFSFNRDVFGSVSKSQCKLYVPKGMVEDYRNHLVWGEFLSILEDANMLGDVTGDGRVDIADVNAVINMMLGKATQTAAGDVTGDGNVDIADVNAVINLMLGK